MTADSKKVFIPLPEPGDIVWCYFPQMPEKLGPKPRPALVIKVAEEDKAVMVVYGTSQKINRIFPSEFILRTGDSGFRLSGLAHDTKFDMGTKLKLPYTSEWFELAPIKSGQPTTSPVMGTLHPVYLPALKKADRQVKKVA
ncbi:MAG TPA: hypothetical protein DIT05_17740 [Morganella sp. (in: Bacteria)]|nr:hypothetical protein [Morganella sp. (in: enterobacteria)]